MASWKPNPSMRLSLNLNSPARCLALLAFALSCFVYATEGASAFDEANKKSVQGLDSLPRWGFPEAINATASMDYQIEYFMGLFLASGLFLVFAAISAFMCPFWMCCRCCHCFCCKRKRHTERMSFRKKWGFLIFILLNCALMTAFAIVAYVANGQFSDAVVDEKDGMLSTVQILLEDLGDFVNETVFEPLDFIKGHTIEAVNNVSRLLQGSAVVMNGTDDLVDELEEFESDWGNYTINITADSGATYTFDCDVCTQVSTVVGDTAEQISDETDPIFEELQDTIDGIQTTLIESNETIVSQITDVSDSMSDLVGDVFEMDDDFEENTRPMIENFNDIRELAYNILFASPLIAFVPVLLGALFRRPACFTFAYSLMWLNFFVMFLMLALHLPFALLLNDLCTFLDDNDSNLLKIQNDTFGELAQACLDDSPIAEVFGIEDDLDFINIDFPSFNSSSITSAFDFSALDDFEVTMNATEVDTFGGIVDQGLDVVNELVAVCVCSGGGSSSDRYTRDNISALVAADYFLQNDPIQNDSYWALQSTAVATVDMISAEDNGEVQFQAVIDGMTGDLTAIANTSAELEDSIETYFNRISTAEVVLNPIIDKAEEVIENGKCGFIGTAYFAIKASMCDDILASLSTMVLCMLLIGIFSLLSCLFSVKMVRRIRPLMDESYSDKPAQPQAQVIILNSQGQPNYAGRALYASEK